MALQAKLTIPESSSYYSLVALIHHRSQKTATAGDLEPGGHYTATLRHIGSKHVLFYDDATNSAVIKEASAKAAAEFLMERSQRKAPIAAVYYLVGGEATQEALYMQSLGHLSNLYGIKIDPQGHGSWPSILDLPPHCHTLAPISHNLIEQHHPEWLDDNQIPIVFSQEYQRPRPTKRFKGATIQPALLAPEYLKKDPTEINTPQISQLKTSIIHSPNLYIPHKSSDHCLLSRLRQSMCTWNLQHIKHQSLWGDPFGDEEWDRREQEQIAARRQRFRDPSPAGPYRRHDEHGAQGSSNTSGTFHPAFPPFKAKI